MDFFAWINEGGTYAAEFAALVTSVSLIGMHLLKGLNKVDQRYKDPVEQVKADYKKLKEDFGEHKSFTLEAFGRDKERLDKLENSGRANLGGTLALINFMIGDQDKQELIKARDAIHKALLDK